MSDTVIIHVPGIARPGGSKTSGYNKSEGKRFVRPANPKTKEWMNAVAYHASAKYRGELLTGPLKMFIIFAMPRPKLHYRSNDPAKGLKPDAPFWHTKAPDITKLIRSTEDALKGIVIYDDCLIADTQARKVYDEKPGALIFIAPITESDDQLFVSPYQIPVD